MQKGEKIERKQSEGTQDVRRKEKKEGMQIGERERKTE